MRLNRAGFGPPMASCYSSHALSWPVVKAAAWMKAGVRFRARFLDGAGDRAAVGGEQFGQDWLGAESAPIEDGEGAVGCGQVVLDSCCCGSQWSFSDTGPAADAPECLSAAEFGRG